MSGEFRVPNREAPQTVREVGLVLQSLWDDLEEYKIEQRLRDAAHRNEYLELKREVSDNTDFRKERMVYERLFKWLIGSNVAVVIGLIIAVITLIVMISQGESVVRTG